MAGRPWRLEGKWLEYCSCDFGCPCEAMAPPTYGHCTGLVAFKIDRGHCGDVDLAGQLVAATFYFPRAIHHGAGHMQPILEARSTEAQRDALFYILSGEDQPVGTMFQIFSVIVEHLHEPLFLDMEFEWDMAARRARVVVPGQARASTEPIRNPVTDEEHHILTVLPHGFTFYEAEVGAGTTKSTGEIKFDLSHRHSSLAHFAWDNNGMAQTYEQFRAA
ncbi:MAG TPA: DUF1326 domain-containing protein [Geminicoccaceae bacterium]